MVKLRVGKCNMGKNGRVEERKKKEKQRKKAKKQNEITKEKNEKRKGLPDLKSASSRKRKTEKKDKYLSPR